MFVLFSSVAHLVLEQTKQRLVVDLHSYLTPNFYITYKLDLISDVQ